MAVDGRAQHCVQAAGRRPREERGFTLLEVVVALAIAGLALAGLFRAASDGLLAVDVARRVDEAVERAQSHLAAFARAGPIEPGTLQGDDGGGYHWRLSATPLAMLRPATLAGGTAPAPTLFDIEVTITWRAGGHARSVVLATRRIGGAPVSQ